MSKQGRSLTRMVVTTEAKSFKPELQHKTRVQTLLSDPVEARKALQKIKAAGVYFFSHNLHELSNEQVFKFMQQILDETRELEDEGDS